MAVSSKLCTCDNAGTCMGCQVCRKNPALAAIHGTPNEPSGQLATWTPTNYAAKSSPPIIRTTNYTASLPIIQGCDGCDYLGGATGKSRECKVCPGSNNGNPIALKPEYYCLHPELTGTTVMREGVKCPHHTQRSTAREERRDGRRTRTPKTVTALQGRGSDVSPPGTNGTAIPAQIGYRPRQSGEVVEGQKESIDLATYFDRVVVINLKRRPERLRAFWKELERIKWPFKMPEVFEAVDGLGLPKPASWKHHDMAHACRQSHVGVLQKAICDRVNSILVLEDDAIFDDDFTQRVTEFLSKVPSDWDGIMLGGMRMEEEPVSEGVVRALNCQRTHCYAARGKYLRSLYSTWLDCQFSIDWGEVVSPVQKKHRVYTPKIWLVDQAAGKSDISGNVEPRRRYFNEKKTKSAPKSLQVFYHIACLNHWKSIVSEQLAQLSRVAIRDVKACVLGSKDDADWVIEEAVKHKVSLSIFHTSEDLSEHETPTLAEAWKRASERPTGTTMYIHVKGVTAPPGHHEHRRKARWRNTMQQAVVVKWEQNLVELATHDAVGTWWAHKPGVFPHFSGNFWMARNDWLARLLDPRLYRVSRDPNSNFAGQSWARMHAEAWIGSLPGPRIKSW